MRSLAKLLLGLACASPLSAGVVVSYDMSTLSGSTASVAATSKDAHLQTATDITRGPGLTVQSGSGVFSSGSWSTASSVNPATSTDYLDFSFTAANGYQLSLTSLTLKVAGSNTAPNTLAVYYSANGFASATLADTNKTITATNNATPNNFTYTLSSVTGTSFEFRIYGFGATGVDGTSGSSGSGSLRFDDIIVNGSLTATAVPEPSTYAALAGLAALGAGWWRRRRRPRA